MVCRNPRDAFQLLRCHIFHKACGLVSLVLNWYLPMFCFSAFSDMELLACIPFYILSCRRSHNSCNRPLHKSCSIPDKSRKSYTLSSFVKAVLILPIVSGEPDPLRTTLSNTTRLIPIASAHSTCVWNFFWNRFRAKCSSLVSLTLLRLISGVIVCVSILLLHLSCIINYNASIRLCRDTVQIFSTFSF
jgi:hypothetical protein